jgi:hypothetical protein
MLVEGKDGRGASQQNWSQIKIVPKVSQVVTGASLELVDFLGKNEGHHE